MRKQQVMVFIVVNCIVSYIAVVNSLKHLKKTNIVTLLIIKTGNYCELTITHSQGTYFYLWPHSGMKLLILFVQFWLQLYNGSQSFGNFRARTIGHCHNVWLDSSPSRVTPRAWWLRFVLHNVTRCPLKNLELSAGDQNGGLVEFTLRSDYSGMLSHFSSVYC